MNQLKNLLLFNFCLFILFSLTVSSQNPQGSPALSTSTYTEEYLIGKGISPEWVAKLMGLPNDLRTQRVDEMDAIKQMIIDEGMLWTAGYNDIFLLPDEQREKLRGLTGAQQAQPTALLGGAQSFDSGMPGGYPDSFDLREHNGVTPVKNQGDCRSCWAFASIAAVEGAIKKCNGTELDLSEQDLVSCWPLSNGCDGSWPNPLFVGSGLYDSWLENPGVVDESCFPYTAPDGSCSDKCSTPTPVKIKEGYSIGPFPNPDDIKNALINYGPVVMIHEIPDDFFTHTGGIYECTYTNDSLHATAIIGWGKQGSTEYWIVKNSWGTATWGESGFYKIKMGACDMYNYPMNYADIDCNSTDCLDTDAGRNLTRFGMAFGTNGVKNDTCKNNISIYESYCKDKKAKYVAKKCPGKCVDGVCVNQVSCIDTDGGIDYTVIGSATDEFRTLKDKCQCKKLREAFCNSANRAVYTVKKCPDKCKQGVCI